MNNLYQNLRDGIVTNVLKQYGMDMILERTVAGVLDPETSVISTGTTELHPVSGLITEYTARDIDGTLIKFGDKKILVNASDTTPEPTSDDVLTIDGSRWPIVRCNPIAPAGLAIVYEVQVRR